MFYKSLLFFVYFNKKMDNSESCMCSSSELSVKLSLSNQAIHKREVVTSLNIFNSGNLPFPTYSPTVRRCPFSPSVPPKVWSYPYKERNSSRISSFVLSRIPSRFKSTSSDAIRSVNALMSFRIVSGTDICISPI